MATLSVRRITLLPSFLHLLQLLSHLKSPRQGGIELPLPVITVDQLRSSWSEALRVALLYAPVQILDCLVKLPQFVLQPKLLNHEATSRAGLGKRVNLGFEDRPQTEAQGVRHVACL